MNDIQPPKQPVQRPMGQTQPYRSVVTQPVSQVPPPIQSIPPTTDSDLALNKPVKNREKKLVAGIFILFILIVALIATSYAWYQRQLAPIDPKNTQSVRLIINSGDSPEIVARSLKQKKLIKSAEAFQIYTKISGTSAKLQAGTYTVSASMSVQAIVKHLTSGKSDTITLTFLPGATVAEDKKVMIDAGYNKERVDAAFSKSYNHPLLADKPANADLEGYVYGETYEFNADDSPEEVLIKIFDEMYKVVTANNLSEKFKMQDLTLYQGITLASIVEREVPDGDDQKLVAGVFYNRLRQNISLGSDVTYQYIADKTGQARDPNLDSPYNTRRYTGLPPGPIANPGKSALLATASPTASEYLFFLSGDDDKTYFAKTDAEHAMNIQNHCQKKCSVL